MACVCGADWTWMTSSTILQTGDMKLIAERLETEGLGGFRDEDDGASVLAAVVRMRSSSIDLVKLILEKGGDPREDGILRQAVARASVAAPHAEVQKHEDIALLLIGRGAHGQVPKRLRRRCPARLAAVLDSWNAWVSDPEADMAEEEHVSLQRKMDRDFALSVSRLREVTRSTRKKEKQLRVQRASKRGGRRKAGESRIEVIAEARHARDAWCATSLCP